MTDMPEYVNSVGEVTGSVVQAGSIDGGVHQHHHVHPAVNPVLPVRWLPAFTEEPVERRELADSVAALLVRRDAVGGVVAIHGGGGYGKTTLANLVSRRGDVTGHFADGVLWVDIGQEVTATALAGKINGLSERLTGARPALVDPMQAGMRLGELLADHRILIVVDDVWTADQLTPLLQGGANCTRLVTTRNAQVVPEGCQRHTIKAMEEEQAVEMLTRRLPDFAIEAARCLGRRCGHWPLLLNLARGQLRAELGRGASIDDALAMVERGLAIAGPVAFDREGERSRAVASTIEASLSRLVDPADPQRMLSGCYRALAVFPRSEIIPFDALRVLWGHVCGWNEWVVEKLCRVLNDHGLTRWVRGDVAGIVLHDVIHEYLSHVGGDRVLAMHAELLDAYQKTLGTREWWGLPVGVTYIRRHLARHLHGAGLSKEHAELASRIRWIASQLKAVGPSAVVADLGLLIGDSHAEALARLIQQTAHLYPPAESVATMSATLRAYVAGQPGVALKGTRSPDRLGQLTTVFSPMPDHPDRRVERTFTDHPRGVRHLVVAPNGRWVASSCENEVSVRDLRTGDGIMLRGHTDEIWGLVVSPDSSWIATAGDQTVRVWDPHSGTSQAVLPGHSNGMTKLVTAPDSSWLASCGRDNAVRVWDPLDGTERAVFKGHTDRVRLLTTPANGAWIASASWHDGVIRFWDPVERVDRGTIDTGFKAIELLLAAPDGSWVAASSGSPGDHGRMGIWDVDTREMRCGLSGPEYTIWRMAVAPDGSWLTASCGVRRSDLRSWDPVSGNELHVLEVPDKGGSFAVAPDSSWLAYAGGFESRSTEIVLWQPAAGTRLGLLRGHTNWVTELAASPDGSRLASGSYDCSVRIWDLPNREELCQCAGHVGWVGSLAWTPDGSLLASGCGPSATDGTVRVWDPHLDHGDSRCRTDTPMGSLALPPDHSWLASAGATDPLRSPGPMRMWDASTGRLRPLPEQVNLEASELLASPRGSWLAGVSVGPFDISQIWVLDVTTEPPRLVLTNESHPVLSLATGSSGSWLVGGGGAIPREDHDGYSHRFRIDDRPHGTIWVWDPRTGALRATRTEQRGPVTELLVAPDESWLASASGMAYCGRSGTVRDTDIHVWDTRSWQTTSVLTGHRAPVTQLVASPDGSWLASASSMDSPSDPFIRLWDPRTGAELRVLEGHRRAIRHLAVTPCGTRIVSAGDDHSVRIWDPGTGLCERVLDHRNVREIAIEPNGTWFASSNEGGLIQTWDITGRRRAVITYSPDWGLSQFRISSNGCWLATVGVDGMIQVWNSLIGEVVADVKVAAPLATCEWLHSDTRLAVAGSRGFYLFDFQA